MIEFLREGLLTDLSIGILIVLTLAFQKSFAYVEQRREDQAELWRRYRL